MFGPKHRPVTTGGSSLGMSAVLPVRTRESVTVRDDAGQAQLSQTAGGIAMTGTGMLSSIGGGTRKPLRAIKETQIVIPSRACGTGLTSVASVVMGMHQTGTHHPCTVVMQQTTFMLVSQTSQFLLRSLISASCKMRVI